MMPIKTHKYWALKTALDMYFVKLTCTLWNNLSSSNRKFGRTKEERASIYLDVPVHVIIEDLVLLLHCNNRVHWILTSSRFQPCKSGSPLFHHGLVLGTACTLWINQSRKHIYEMSERTDLYTMVNVLKLRSLTTVIFTCSFAKLPEGSPEADWLMGGWEGRQEGGREGRGEANLQFANRGWHTHGSVQLTRHSRPRCGWIDLLKLSEIWFAKTHHNLICKKLQKFDLQKITEIWFAKIHRNLICQNSPKFDLPKFHRNLICQNSPKFYSPKFHRN